MNNKPAKPSQEEKRRPSLAGIEALRAADRLPPNEGATSEEYLAACRALFSRIEAFTENDDEAPDSLSRELDAINQVIGALDRVTPPALTLDEIAELIHLGSKAHNKVRQWQVFYQTESLSEPRTVFTTRYLLFTGGLLALQKSHPDFRHEVSGPSPEFRTAALNAAMLAQEVNALPESERAEVLKILGLALSAKIGTAPAVADRISSSAAIPDQAPELWSARDEDVGETSIAFLQRVYRGWIDQMHLQDIAMLDEPLYQALQTWRRRHKIPPHLKSFFSRQRRSRSEVDAELKKYNIKKPEDAFARFPDDKSKAQRLYHACRSRLGT